ncbi:MAG: oxaloacetate decarboxylase [Synechococcaceae cyanobacterium]|nr:oxaloacetate decarboxylase [Synechococcaceae cyanobacterium]
MTRRTTRFRQLLAAPEILMMPCCHDALSARVLEQAGFEAIAAAGFGLAGSLLGAPDIGLLDGSEMLQQYRRIAEAVQLPLFVDLDTGFGDLNNVIRAVRAAEDAGVAALFLEDQSFPKRCGHMSGKQVVPVAEYLPKLRAALAARRDPDLVITARTDAAAVLGFDEALRRARLYAEAGADLVFVEALESREQMQQANALLASCGAASMANQIEGGRSPLLTAAELQALGYAVVAHPCGSLFTMVRALQDWAAHLRDHGGTAGFRSRMVDFDIYLELVDLAAVRARQARLEAPDEGLGPA